MTAKNVTQGAARGAAASSREALREGLREAPREGLREASREELQKGLCMLRLLKLGLRLRLLVDGLSLRLFFIYKRPELCLLRELIKETLMNSTKRSGQRIHAR